MSFEKLLVFTDLHIVPEGERIIGIDPAERLSEAIKHAVALHPDATGSADGRRRIMAPWTSTPVSNR